MRSSCQCIVREYTGKNIKKTDAHEENQLFSVFFLPLWDNMGEYDTEKRDKLNNLPDLGME